MTIFSYQSDDTGNTFTFASEEAYEAASDWYNRTEKERVVEFCKERGVDLLETTDDPYFRTGQKLIDDWADVAMELYAKA